MPKKPPEQLLHAFAYFGFFTLVHFVGLYLFQQGFLLNRVVINGTSVANTLPWQQEPSSNPVITQWHPAQFNKAVILIIDALRDDFVIPQPDGMSNEHFHNILTYPHETACRETGSSGVFTFVADPPTTTLQRLKGLTTGNMPTFIDAGSNFAGTDIDEDNIIAQLKTAGKRLVFAGDDTWSSLFPDKFDEFHPYESFNVPDLHTVDDNVKRHLLDALDRPAEWDVFVGHFLGVDHAGHTFGPDHGMMRHKLGEMDELLRYVVPRLDDDTVLFVMGDHGMDERGNHGGDSWLEVRAGLWIYSSRSFMPQLCGTFPEVEQIDFVPTFSFLMGLPVPFNNLGFPITHVFAAQSERELSEMGNLTAEQVNRYATEYRLHGSIDHAQTDNALQAARSAYASGNAYGEAYSRQREYQKQILSIYRRMWAQYDTSFIWSGVALLLASLFTMAATLLAMNDGFRLDTFYMWVKWPTCFSALIYGVAVYSYGLQAARGLLWCCALLVNLVVLVITIPYLARRFCFSHLLPLLIPALHYASFGSNSFTVWEDKVVYFLMATVLFIMLLKSHAGPGAALARYYVLLSAVILRMLVFVSVCREEQAPFCAATFYTSSKLAGLTVVALSFFLAVAVPLVLRQHLILADSYLAPVNVWVVKVVPLVQVTISAIATIDISQALSLIDINTLVQVKHALAWLVIVAVVPVGGLLYYTSALSIQGVVSTPRRADKARSVTIKGYTNVHGSLYLIFVLLAFCLFGVLTLPPGNLSLTGCLWVMMNMVELHALQPARITAGLVVVFAYLLGHATFFSTGHQATLQSIQWKVAFVANSTVVYPWSPLFVVINSFSAHMFVALFVPLLVLWRTAPTNRPETVVMATVRAMGLLVLLYAGATASSMVMSGHLRRHLMVWKIFAPRFMSAALTLLAVDFVATFSVFAFAFPKAFGEVYRVLGAPDSPNSSS